jgi:hypothetical protein
MTEVPGLLTGWSQWLAYKRAQMTEDAESMPIFENPAIRMQKNVENANHHRIAYHHRAA